MTGSLVAVIVCHVDHGAPVGEEGGDASEGAEVVDFEIIHADMDSEIFFEIHHQLHELQRVQKARLDQIRLRQRNVERSEEHTSELQSRLHLVCRLLLEKKK